MIVFTDKTGLYRMNFQQYRVSTKTDSAWKVKWILDVQMKQETKLMEANTRSRYCVLYYI